MLAKNRFNQIIASNLKRIREEKGIAQDKLSMDCGFFRTYVGLVENCRKSPSAFSIYRLAKGLEVTVDDLFPKTV